MGWTASRSAAPPPSLPWPGAPGGRRGARVQGGPGDESEQDTEGLERCRAGTIVGLDAGGDTTLDELDVSGPIVVVVGSEGKGLSRLVRVNCDAIVSISMAGPTESLNASVAAGVVLAEIAPSVAEPSVSAAVVRRPG